MEKNPPVEKVHDPQTPVHLHVTCGSFEPHWSQIFQTRSDLCDVSK